MTIKTDLKDANRNQLCPCGSMLKQKHCHGDPVKLQLCNNVARRYMLHLILEERKKHGIDPYAFTCKSCGKGTDNPEVSQIATATPTFKCPECGSTDLVKYVLPVTEEKPEENKSIIMRE
jgi:DNA-directed RNA polymerase subunit RPC12/RpoP